MGSNLARPLILLALLEAAYACAERQSPFEPVVLTPRRPALTALAGASGHMPVPPSDMGGDPLGGKTTGSFATGVTSSGYWLLKPNANIIAAKL